MGVTRGAGTSAARGRPAVTDDLWSAQALDDGMAVDDCHPLFEGGGDFVDVGRDVGVVKDLVDGFGRGVGEADAAAAEGDGEAGGVERCEGVGPVGGVDFAGAGGADDVGFGSGGDGAAVGHQDEPVALLGFLHVVGGDQDAGAVLGLRMHGVPQACAGERVDAGGGFVQDEEFGPVG